MSIVNHETGKMLGAPTYGEVRESVEAAKSSLAEAAEHIVWQVENRVWRVLGHDSWDAMREAEYGGAAFMVPRADRPELVARMRRSGLTQQAIADTAGVSTDTVQRDLNAAPAVLSEPITITNARGQERPATYAKTQSPAPAPAPAAVDELPRSIPGDREQSPATSSEAPGRVTGIDDKTYARPERPALTAQDAVTEFPDLAYYVEIGRASDAIRMAADLRRFRERGELPKRLAILRRSIEVDKAERNGTLTDLPIRTSHCPTCRCQETP